MITREQVADLRPGDVVEYSGHPDLKGAKVIGPACMDGGFLVVAGYVLRDPEGRGPTYMAERLSLTVISRTLRPLYVNHDRAEPVPGDVVRDADSDDRRTWMYRQGYGPSWTTHVGDGTYPGLIHAHQRRELLPARLRLLVDGETGQVVQP